MRRYQEVLKESESTKEEEKLAMRMKVIQEENVLVVVEC
jgi:hypothetical protein